MPQPLTPAPQTLNDLAVCAQHIALYLQANRERTPYSDAVTRITCFGHRLPAWRCEFCWGWHYTKAFNPSECTASTNDFPPSW